MADLEACSTTWPSGPSWTAASGCSARPRTFVALWVAAAPAGGAPLPVVTWNAPASLRELPGADPDQAAAPSSPRSGAGSGRRARRVSRVLVIQGRPRRGVPPDHGRRLFERAAEPRPARLAGADHRLTDPDHRRDALERAGASCPTISPAEDRSVITRR